mmetsp:Transcript_76869/g.249047  ORF Transcript_76869/g.249047 Transcript_76869/m.249047 type:complete len:181 (-) Transcript_76869:191-733(-)
MPGCSTSRQVWTVVSMEALTKKSQCTTSRFSRIAVRLASTSLTASAWSRTKADSVISATRNHSRVLQMEAAGAHFPEVALNLLPEPALHPLSLSARTASLASREVIAGMSAVIAAAVAAAVQQMKMMTSLAWETCWRTRRESAEIGCERWFAAASHLQVSVLFPLICTALVVQECCTVTY